MDTAGVILTYKDYESLPAGGRRYEIHEGELSVTPAPSPRHQEVLGNLYAVLREHVGGRGPGKVFFAPIDVILSDRSIVQPDLVYLESGRLGAVSSRGIEGPPTLVVEVVSPSTSQIDRHTKLQLYARHGVPHYWVVDPEACLVDTYKLAEGAYRPGARINGDETLAAPPFLALAIPASALWR